MINQSSQTNAKTDTASTTSNATKAGTNQKSLMINKNSSNFRSNWG